ncbi:lipoprotein [Spiroplasma floricola]|uniref:Lipoprotein n=1 Tax=Spiroplasma floricola 23-6 TaxID=1336749 RepID=A0A2K8SF87_9MOLU|nr:lipoprotein [Spiroplasma floricola]AUB31908.1 hypothetical protein SFLOR_v1c08600 [Spiroplasma floricola 23-6]
MKKLLGILSAVSLTVSSPSLVVACATKERITSPKLNRDLAKQLLVSISGNKDLANIDFGSMFTDSEIESVVVNMVNELLSLQYSFDSTNSIYDRLGFKEKYTSTSEGIENLFKDKYKLETRTIAENKLFEEYTKSIKGDRLDYWSVQNSYSLNIQKATKVKSFDGTEDISVSKKNKYIYFNSGDTASEDKIWRFTYEDSKNKSAHLPEIKDLTSEYSGEKKAVFGVVDDSGKYHKISSKTALYLRFQDYFESKILEELNENLLTTAYLKSTMFDIKDSKDKGKSPYINSSSSVFSKTQTLSDSSSESWKTNVKMVWTIRFDITEPSTIDIINQELRKQSIIDPSNGALKTGKSISEIYNLFPTTSSKDGVPKPVIDNKSGYDSYFGWSGYQGLTIYNGDSSLGDSPISGKAYEANVKSWTKGAGIVKNGSNFLTVDSSNSNYADLVLVLPVYMIELLGGSNPTESTYEITGKGKDDKKAMIFSNTIGNDNVYTDRWNNNNNKDLHSKDIQDLVNNQNTGKQAQAALLNQIMYGISKDSSSSDLAKTIIYSKYLDKDEVYYAGLWNKIGSYIKNENDKDE